MVTIFDFRMKIVRAISRYFSTQTNSRNSSDQKILGKVNLISSSGQDTFGGIDDNAYF